MIEQNTYSQKQIDSVVKHLKQAKENDLLSDSMMSMLLAQLLEENATAKENIIAIAYEILNDA
mgnify:CR=1 FL=1